MKDKSRIIKLVASYQSVVAYKIVISVIVFSTTIIDEIFKAQYV